MRNVKWNLVLACLFAVSSAFADIFVFNDLAGYEKCLAADHVVDTTKTSGGSQTRFLDQMEVKDRCISSAVTLLSKQKNAGTIKEFIASTKRATAPENSVDLCGVLVGISRPACNDMEVYSVLHKALSHPKSKAQDSYFAKARKVVKNCLKDADFKKDFTEEKDASDSYLKANACEILLEEKIVKSCQNG